MAALTPSRRLRSSQPRKHEPADCRYSPFVPAKELVKLLQPSLARTYPLSSPRRRGPIATELSISRRPNHLATTQRMGPRLRGDDSGTLLASHILSWG